MRANSPNHKKKNKKKKRSQSSEGAISDKSDVEMLSKKSEDVNSQEWISDDEKQKKKSQEADFDVDAIIE